MKKPGPHFPGGVELAAGGKIVRFVVKKADLHAYVWLADFRTFQPGAPLSDGLGVNVASSASSSQNAVSAAISFFESEGVYLTPEQQVELAKPFLNL